MAGLIDWAKQDFLTVRQASCLLTGDYPYYDDDRFLTSEAAQVATALRRAISAKQIPVAELWIRLPYGGDVQSEHEGPVPQTAIGNGTILEQGALQEWCTANGKRWPFASYIQPAEAASQSGGKDFPPELQAAIEAFEAVSRDPAATAKQTPKAALTAWLAAHKPELSGHARDRIATVANWQPQGGAPKTPG